MMKVISITTWLMLLILAGCSDASPYAEEPSAQERTITLNLDITTRADELLPDNSEPDIIQLWIFDNNENLITYVVSSQNVWTPVGTDGIDIKTTLQTEIEAENIDVNQSFKIYLLLNQPYTDDGKGSTTPVDFSDVKTLDELKGKMFVLTEYKGDNKVPMTGEGTTTFPSVEGNKIIFDASINATRCVAKLGIYCTKGNLSSTLTINQVTLSKVPDKGYLFKPDDYSLISYSESGKNLLSESKQISSYYTEDMPPYSNNSWDEEAEGSFEEISSPYLLENPNGEVTDDGFLQVNGSITDDDKRYCITLSYTLNGVGYTQNIYVSQIKRNQYSKIYIRINDAITVDDICCQVNSWTEHEIDVPVFE
ncbi:hypothetical protein QUW56_09215 [Phocaeicola barnesiae]|uniref:hypothetical protein n=1 Tax=Phocaeicola barnesiae TaxID=376804 RepID=UPI0025A385A6|nr:hypothetical protein [Phocaeicola barnesiae]MDM8233547.1 hypothetical protein [Phocaeicola barnesiae]